MLANVEGKNLTDCISVQTCVCRLFCMFHYHPVCSLTVTLTLTGQQLHMFCWSGHFKPNYPVDAMIRKVTV